jgi:hypothetical protein
MTIRYSLSIVLKGKELLDGTRSSVEAVPPFSQVKTKHGKSRREPAGDPESLPGRKHRETRASHCRHGDPPQRGERHRIRSRSHDLATAGQKNHDDEEWRRQHARDDRCPEHMDTARAGNTVEPPARALDHPSELAIKTRSLPPAVKLQRNGE